MSVKSILRKSGTADMASRPPANDIRVDAATETLKFSTGDGSTNPPTVKEVMDLSSAQAITGAKEGMVITKSVRLVENGAGTSYTGTIPIPAGAIIHDIKVIAEALWNGTSAAADVGDDADPNGYFSAINLKATDLLVGEILSTMDSTLWGGKEGVYLVAATGRRGPTSSNFGPYYAAGSNISIVVTPGAADGSAGRTVLSVTYSVGVAIDQVAV